LHEVFSTEVSIFILNIKNQINLLEVNFLIFYTELQKLAKVPVRTPENHQGLPNNMHRKSYVKKNIQVLNFIINFNDFLFIL